MKQPDHRQWTPKSFHSIDGLKAELDQIESAHRAGTLRTTGQWTVGQNLEHCATIIRCSFDGFDASAPLVVRIFGSLVFKRMIRNPNGQMKPGIKLPKRASSVLPSDKVRVEDGLAMMRTQLARIDAGEKMTQPSPVMGKMTHDLWILMHLNHCRLHMGFFAYADQ